MDIDLIRDVPAFWAPGHGCALQEGSPWYWNSKEFRDCLSKKQPGNRFIGRRWYIASIYKCYIIDLSRNSADCHFASTENICGRKSVLWIELEEWLSVNQSNKRFCIFYMCAMVKDYKCKTGVSRNLSQEKMLQQLQTAGRFSQKLKDLILFYPFANRCFKRLSKRHRYLLIIFSIIFSVGMYQSNVQPLNHNLSLINHPCCKC